MQKITVALPKALLRQVKVAAVNRQTSVSALLAQLLQDFVARDRRSADARRRALARLDKPHNLGTGGQISWSREELHYR